MLNLFSIMPIVPRCGNKPGTFATVHSSLSGLTPQQQALEIHVYIKKIKK